MNKETIKVIMNDLEEAVKAVGEKHQFAIPDGVRIRYSDTGFTFSTDAVFTANVSGDEIDAEKAMFDEHCVKHGLKPDDYGKTVHVMGDAANRYEICGIKPKARKNAVKIRHTQTGKIYVAPAAILRDENWVSLIDSHKCKYCGARARGSDEDLLCDNCRELFGHTYYSEL